MAHTTDLDVTARDVIELASADALTALLARFGYDTRDRAVLSPEAVGLTGESASAIKRIELLSEDPEQFLRVVFAQPKSLTAKVRNDLVRVLGRSNRDHLLILASDFDTLELVFLDKRKREQKGPAGSERIQVVPKTIGVSRRGPTRLDLRTLRRFTWTGRDALEQFDKLRGVFDAAAYIGEYFQNRGLFSDYFLRDRLRDDAAWRDNPSATFAFVRDLMRDAQTRWSGKDKDTLRNELLEPLFKKLGFKPAVNRPSKTDQTQPDYLLSGGAGVSPVPSGGTPDPPLTAAFVYAWDRWLDGPDLNDADTPEENPGACVVTALDEGTADWILVTNGRLWRLYSRQAHARATNFYEVDLVEALTASGDTDPNEAFRYWWLFFRPDAFSPLAPGGRGVGGEGGTCWLDAILLGSREYAKRLGDRLKDRIFLTIFPHLAQGFLVDRKQRLGQTKEPTEEERTDIFEATLTLLYRLLFLLYAESRDLLPIREAPYHAASLKKIKEEIADRAGVAEGDVPERLNKGYSAKETTLYDRLGQLFRAMDRGDPILNVPIYNGGLFNTAPLPSPSGRGAGGEGAVFLPSPPLRGRGVGGEGERREQRIARFLLEHKVPDRYLALAIDRLARDQDERTLALVSIDYKSLEVRHLGSIYEGLLEFKLKVAEEDLTTQADKKGETYIPLSKAKASGRRKPAGVVVSRGQVYLSNDKAERKASGSYYTPDPIVEYIVANTVGPVLEEKLEALRPEFRKVRKTFDNEVQKSKAYPSKEVRDGKIDHRQWAGLQTYNAHKELVESLFDLRVLDPAMGSGHFLVETVDFVTDRLLKFLNGFPINPVNFALDRTRASILESLGEQGVTVDPAKLTDINLLKRHVLKRCIYGVDLNPMAVELAKVSLWLDAFTLGAPLNFLDHHLRCGNSLIGATFKELEGATATLFALNYEPLLRAINNVLFVSKMADATAAEVATSVNRYDQARQALAGYQIVLNLLVAEHFGIPKAASLVKEGQDLKLEGREKLLASLHDDKERKLVAEVEALAKRPDRRFFHWEIEFPEVFFGFVDDDHRQIKHKDRIEEGTAGFDCVVGNPPYDVLAEKELEIDLEDLLGFFNSGAVFQAARGGKQNLYKLFICRGAHLLRRGGGLGHIVPMPLLGDEQAAGVRKMLLTDTCLAAVEAFPQKDDARNRVFEDAKLSTCIFITAKKNEDAPFRARVHPGKSIAPASPSLIVRRSQVKLYDPENQPIVACSQEDWDLAAKIMGSGRMRRLGEFCAAYQGEVNETTDRGKGNISYAEKDGPRILRGANVTLYALRPSSQGEDIFMLRNKFLKGKKPTAKAWHHQKNRIGFQRKSPQNNFRRLIACYVPKGEFCCESISYFPEQESAFPLNVLLGLLNSKLVEWFFRLGSTNAMVSEYQINNLPAPLFKKDRKPEVIQSFNHAVAKQKWDDAFGVVVPLIVEAPFPPSIMACLMCLVDEISKIEAARGDIARTERSALAPEAQPYQDLIDRILYRMAGLTDTEAQGLEKRLEGML